MSCYALVAEAVERFVSVCVTVATAKKMSRSVNSATCWSSCWRRWRESSLPWVKSLWRNATSTSLTHSRWLPGHENTLTDQKARFFFLELFYFPFLMQDYSNYKNSVKYNNKDDSIKYARAWATLASVTTTWWSSTGACGRPESGFPGKLIAFWTAECRG